MKRRQLIIEVDCDDVVTVGALREEIRRTLFGNEQTIHWNKGTLPDPQTRKTGRIYWPSLRVKQLKTK